MININEIEMQLKKIIEKINEPKIKDEDIQKIESKKQTIKKYLNNKLECFNMEKIKANGYKIKVFMSQKLFDLLENDMENLKISGDKKSFWGEYKGLNIWKRMDYTTDNESILCFIDRNTDADIMPYI